MTSQMTCQNGKKTELCKNIKNKFQSKIKPKQQQNAALIEQI